MRMRPVQLNRTGLAGLAGIPLIPVGLVEPLRSYFLSRGISASAVNDVGEVEPQAILALAYDKITIKTRVGQYTYDMNDTDPSKRTRSALRWLQPAIIATGRAGTSVISAPYGVPTSTFPIGIVGGLGLGAAVLGLMWIGKRVL